MFEPQPPGDPEALATPHWLEQTDHGPYDEDAPEWSAQSWSEAQRWPQRWRHARWSPGRAGALALVVVGIVLTVATVVSLRLDQPVVQSVPALPTVETQPLAVSTPGQPSGAHPLPSSPTDDIVVSVVGLVPSPGLVTLPSGSRVADALAAAGGVREGADTISLNLAQRLADGDQVSVGAIAAEATPGIVGSATTGTGSLASRTRSGSTPGLVSLNNATEEEFDALPGVGPVTAAAIVSWRKKNGKFTDIAQLAEVDGIGPARLEKLRDQVTL